MQAETPLKDQSADVDVSGISVEGLRDIDMSSTALKWLQSICRLRRSIAGAEPEQAGEQEHQRQGGDRLPA
ncbi:MAG: hypothetical protein DSY92_07680 [Planctomycetota bacterium]|nr:MAG: hypothetical protein DSY92_07680 [Planctomycetota bacterium]